jgi:hypothetical protein
LADKQPTNSRKNPGRPFQKGTSGNPNGRPKKGDSMADICNELLSAKSIRLTITPQEGTPIKKLIKSQKSIRHAVAVIQIEKALAGDMPAVNFLTDRSEGRPAQTIIQKDSNKPDFTELTFITMKQ